MSDILGREPVATRKSHDEPVGDYDFEFDVTPHQADDQSRNDSEEFSLSDAPPPKSVYDPFALVFRPHIGVVNTIPIASVFAAVESGDVTELDALLTACNASDSAVTRLRRPPNSASLGTPASEDATGVSLLVSAARVAQPGSTYHLLSNYTWGHSEVQSALLVALTHVNPALLSVYLGFGYAPSFRTLHAAVAARESGASGPVGAAAPEFAQREREVVAILLDAGVVTPSDVVPMFTLYNRPQALADALRRGGSVTRKAAFLVGWARVVPLGPSALEEMDKFDSDLRSDAAGGVRAPLDTHSDRSGAARDQPATPSASNGVAAASPDDRWWAGTWASRSTIRLPTNPIARAFVREAAAEGVGVRAAAHSGLHTLLVEALRLGAHVCPDVAAAGLRADTGRDPVRYARTVNSAIRRKADGNDGFAMSISGRIPLNISIGAARAEAAAAATAAPNVFPRPSTAPVLQRCPVAGRGDFAQYIADRVLRKGRYADSYLSGQLDLLQSQMAYLAATATALGGAHAATVSSSDGEGSDCSSVGGATRDGDAHAARAALGSRDMTPPRRQAHSAAGGAGGGQDSHVNPYNPCAIHAADAGVPIEELGPAWYYAWHRVGLESARLLIAAASVRPTLGARVRAYVESHLVDPSDDVEAVVALVVTLCASAAAGRLAAPSKRVGFEVSS